MLTCGLLRSNFSLPIAPISLAISWLLLNSWLLRNFALHSRHDLFRNVFRNFLVTGEVHGETAASLRARTKLGRITKHLAQRNTGLDNLRRTANLGPFKLAAAGNDVAVYRTHVFFRHYNLDGHYRFEQHRLGFAQ